MRRQLAAFACVVLLFASAGSETARAAFIAPVLDSGAGMSVSDPTIERGSMEDHSQVLQTPNKPGAPGSRFYFRTGRGITSTGTSVPTPTGAAGPAMQVSVTCIEGGRLVFMSEREGRCVLPTPHLCGVFRPPRSCS